MVERGPLQGRQQEWNVSRKELQELVSAPSHPDHPLMALAASAPFMQTRLFLLHMTSISLLSCGDYHACIVMLPLHLICKANNMI